MRVLIVDDYPDTAEIAGYLLTKQGHDCRTATSSADALALAEAFKPELAILDIGLPGIDGYQLASALRYLLANDPPYLVAMTGWAQELDRARGAGFDHWLLKPADREKLRRVVELAQRRSSSS